MTPEKYDQLALKVAEGMPDYEIQDGVDIDPWIIDFARRLREEWMNGQEPTMRTGGGEINIGAVTLELAHRTCTRYVHEGPITYGFTEQHMIDFAKRLVERVKADQAVLTVGAEQKESEPVAIAIHYPECWDTAAYPTVWDAFAEVAAWFKCSNDECAQKPPSATQAEIEAAALEEAAKLYLKDDGDRLMNEYVAEFLRNLAAKKRNGS